MADQLIPKQDSPFALRARVFASAIVKDPQRYSLSCEDAERLDRAVKAFRDALALAMNPRTRTQAAVIFKRARRKEAEDEVRRCRRIISANDRISEADKSLIFVKERSTSASRTRCPLPSPRLAWAGTENDAGFNSTLHVLKFWHFRKDGSSTRWAPGAVRIELFVDLVPPGQPVPKYPGQYLGGRPWYLRSFTKSPMKVTPPFPPMPMLVVYWARWADSAGNVGPWSQTVRTRVEGWSAETATPALREESQHQLPENQPKLIAMAMQLCDQSVEQAQVMGLLTDARQAVDAMRQLAGPTVTHTIADGVALASGSDSDDEAHEVAHARHQETHPLPVVR